MQRLLALLTFLVAGISFGNAQFAAGAGTTSTKAALLSEVRSIALGKSFFTALQLAHPEEWHSYYKNSGGVEWPPSLVWTLPEGFTAGPLQWPVPEVKDGFSGKSFVYHGTPVFLVEITPPGSLKTVEPVTLTAMATWQICKESCINEEKSFTLVLPVTAEAEVDPAQTALFEKARLSQARVLPNLEVSAHSDGGDLHFLLTPGDAIMEAPADFIPDQPFLQPASAGGSIQREESAWLITLKRKKMDFFDQPVVQGKSFSGILTGPAAIQIPDTPILHPPARPLPFSKYLPILGGMLLGGLILNLMPCVFP